MEVAARQQLANLQHAVDLLQQALEAGQLPVIESVPEDVRRSLALTAALATGLLVLLVPRTRKLVLETAESVLTIVLLVVLMVIVVGMPVGVLYMSFRGLVFLVTSVGGSLVARVPMLEGWAWQAQKHLRAWLPGNVAMHQQQQQQADPVSGSAVLDGSS